MSYRKKASVAMAQAVQRISGLKSIATDLDLGNGLTVVEFQTAIDDVEAVLNTYNTHLSVADELKNNLESKEKALRDFSERILTGVAAKFGKDSNQYQMAGGTKKSQIKRKVRKKVNEDA
ncbi:hypothetical protein [Lacihabitans sp. CS3-21]|uniref:hypothetical protein n=1 Tax=Lacihabitans sp. CS3-21 TaxID=2487332 RepID=UPI0020CCC1EE|nr:hypothetical protein [Lacihabitans sp. CS3-21]MCP9747574.1 hypothetical protein [Lacihabitans sp. CS3-21]MCP9747903.1 hypothetical protein [Lacihabitans sp. CS3-21]